MGPGDLLLPVGPPLGAYIPKRLRMPATKPSSCFGQVAVGEQFLGSLAGDVAQAIGLVVRNCEQQLGHLLSTTGFPSDLNNVRAKVASSLMFLRTAGVSSTFDSPRLHKPPRPQRPAGLPAGRSSR